jgi:hypothetical protein
MKFTTRGNFHRVLAAALMLLALAAAAPCRAEVRNMTQENRTALAAKILELRQSELMRIARGRIKPNPISLPQFTIYQTALLDQELMLTRQLNDYKSALGEMQRARKDFAAFAATPLGASVSQIFDARIISTYTLKEKIEKAGNIWEIWFTVTGSGLDLQSLPVEYRMALNAGAWLQRMAGPQPPQTLVDKFLDICRAEIHSLNVFDSDILVNGLSLKYSNLFIEAVGAGEPK